MRDQLRAEFLRLRSTRSVAGLFVAMVALVLLAILLHGLGIGASALSSRDHQLTIFGRGELLGVLFGALVGAVSITAEYRHGTIRPTFLVMPRRHRVVLAKVTATMAVAAGFGAVACGLAVGAGALVLRMRGIDVRLSGGDEALLIGGGAVAAGLWAPIGLAVGAVVRNQVPALIGICAWLLFIEGLLVGDVASVTAVGRFGPGAAATALTGQQQDVLLAPVYGLVLLVGYAAAGAFVAVVSTVRRDVA